MKNLEIYLDENSRRFAIIIPPGTNKFIEPNTEPSPVLDALCEYATSSASNPSDLSSDDDFLTFGVLPADGPLGVDILPLLLELKGAYSSPIVEFCIVSNFVESI